MKQLVVKREGINRDALKVLMASRAGFAGMAGPFRAETASVKGDPDWPLWMVRDDTCNSLGCLMPREVAEAVADEMNAIREDAA